MGSNRRYAASLDRRARDRDLQRLAETLPLQSLTPKELELDRQPVTIDPRPQQVKAWVRFGDVPVEVDAEAVRWTARAVGILFTIAGKNHGAWVWSSAVTQLSDSQPNSTDPPVNAPHGTQE